jgi:hypothetical protein
LTEWPQCVLAAAGIRFWLCWGEALVILFPGRFGESGIGSLPDQVVRAKESGIGVWCREGWLGLKSDWDLQLLDQAFGAAVAAFDLPVIGWLEASCVGNGLVGPDPVLQAVAASIRWLPSDEVI